MRESFDAHAERLESVEGIVTGNNANIAKLELSVSQLQILLTQRFDVLVEIATRQATLLDQLVALREREANEKSEKAQARRQAIKRLYTDTKHGIQAVWRVIKKPFGIIVSVVAGYLSLKLSGNLPPALGGDEDLQQRKGQESAPQDPDAGP